MARGNHYHREGNAWCGWASLAVPHLKWWLFWVESKRFQQMPHLLTISSNVKDYTVEDTVERWARRIHCMESRKARGSTKVTHSWDWAPDKSFPLHSRAESSEVSDYGGCIWIITLLNINGHLCNINLGCSESGKLRGSDCNHLLLCYLRRRELEMLQYINDL